MKNIEVEIREPNGPYPFTPGAMGEIEVEVVEREFDYIDFDNECTCELMEWEPTEDGFKGCPFCEAWDGFIED